MKTAAKWGCFVFVVTAFIALITLSGIASVEGAKAAESGNCQPFDDGVKAIVHIAHDHGSELAVVPPNKMSDFLAALHKNGIDIVGEAAVIVETPEHQMAIFVKRGDLICLAAATSSDSSATDPNP